MRRLVLVLTVCALALLGASSAGAAAKPGTIVVRAAGHAPIRVLLRIEGKARVLGRAHGPGTKRPQKITVRLNIPPLLPSGRWPVIVCVSNSCKRVSWLRGVESANHPGPSRNAGATTPPAAAPPTAIVPVELGSDIAPPPISTVPTDPIPYTVAQPFFHSGGGVEYSAFIPRSYDPTNQTPMTLFIWLHGCGGEAEGSAWVVDPGADEEVEQDWMTLSLAGRESPGDECWVPSVDEPKVMAALADFETHFNVNRQRVILGGYSSGGDLAYRTGFRHSSTFAELLIENSSPFRDTESTQAESLGAATTKFPIVHLAHAQDTTYKLGEVEPEIAAVRAAGFPVEFIVRPGGHSDSHTDPDLLTYLLPHIDDGWLAP